MMYWPDIVILSAVAAGLFLAVRAIRRRKKCRTGCIGCPLSGSCTKPEKNKEQK